MTSRSLWENWVWSRIRSNFRCHSCCEVLLPVLERLSLGFPMWAGASPPLLLFAFSSCNALCVYNVVLPCMCTEFSSTNVHHSCKAFSDSVNDYITWTLPVSGCRSSGVWLSLRNMAAEPESPAADPSSPAGVMAAAGLHLPMCDLGTMAAPPSEGSREREVEPTQRP